MKTVRQCLHAEGTPQSLVETLDAILLACKEIASQLHQGALAGILGCAGQENVQGETQKKLDVVSNDLLKSYLKNCPFVAGMASEEEDDPVEANKEGEYLVLFDPLDGSSNIDVNVTVGTIFSILPAKGDASKVESYLQPGNQQIAAGYVVYGPSTLLVLSTGKGVNVYTLHTGALDFLLTREQVKIPAVTKEFAINMSNQRFWEPAMQNYVADMLKGEEGPLEKRYNMRWVASMVAEVHRIITRGGIFMYPWDSREPLKPGKLRLMYEGNPMSFLVEQAGGAASNTKMDIMDVQPGSIHERVSVVLGSKTEVEIAVKYHN